jgi:hypothetical protein
MHKILFSCAAIAAALAISACGSATDEEPAAQTVTVVERTVVEKPALESKPAAASKPKPKPKPAAAESASRISVPNVVGENHQYAQDTMQAAGLYVLDEEDATGQGRMLVWDRNWVVVEQIPAAGTMVTEDTTITLRSKKDGE